MIWWIPIVVASISLAGVIFVPVFTNRHTQRLTQQQYDALQRQSQMEADAREERLRNRWRQTSDDIDYLWSFFQDEVAPWMRDAYSLLKPEHPDFPRPPVIKPREHHGEAPEE